ncbi:hypothetical protein BDV10DRAFT_184006 [Aspergillus recurvatus]
MPANALFTPNEMAVSHNIYILRLDAIYNQAEGATAPSDTKDSLTFFQIWIEIIHTTVLRRR